MSTIEERVAALEQLGEHIGERIYVIERLARGLNAGAPLAAPTPRATAPLPATTVKIDPAPRHPTGPHDSTCHRDMANATQPLQEWARGADRLVQIESELAALALRRGALVGERERLRT